MVTFDLTFIPTSIVITAPYFCNVSEQTQTLLWSEAMAKALQHSEAALDGAVILGHSHHNVSTSLTVDATGQAVGVFIQQLVLGI